VTVSNSDATVTIEADVPAYLRDIDEMTSKTESMFGRMAKKLGSVFSGMLSGGGSGNFQQSPMAMTTKELEKQHKASLEMLKVERMRRDLQRAARFDSNRAKYGDDAELNENGELRRSPRGHRFQQTIAGLSSAVNMGHQFMNSGGSNAGYMQLGTSIASALAPTFAPLINAVGSVGIDMFKKQENAREMGLLRYQAGGMEGAYLTNGGSAWPGMSLDHLRKKQGFNWGSYTNTYTKAARSGALEAGDPSQVMSALMSGEAGFGVGGQLSNLYGASGRTGSGNADQATGAVLGLKIAEGMSRGRMGELIDQLASAIDMNTEASTNLFATADRFLFISQATGQKGNTAANREMDQSIRGLAQGNTPYTSMTSLSAAGFGTGKTYAEAKLATQMGLDTEGGVSSEAIITTNYGSYVALYAKANAAGKADILDTLSTLTGMSMPKVKKIMDRLATGPLGKVSREEGMGGMHQTVPDFLLAPRRDRAKGEDAFRPDMATNGPGDVIGSFDTSNEVAMQAISAQKIEQMKAEGWDPKTGWPEGRGPGSGGGGSSKTDHGFIKNFVSGGGGRFGARGGKHEGQDLMFKPKTKIYSPCDGKVTTARSSFSTDGRKPQKGDGGMVVIEAAGETWRMHHLVKIAVKVNQVVSQGDFIGETLGFSHWQNGKKTHLHAELLRGGSPVDPVMNADLGSLISPAIIHPGSGGGGPLSADASSGGAASTSSAAASAGGGSGAVQVQINVIDKTAGGVNVQQETKAYAKQSTAPAPGDTPAQSSE
jgi:hypothetical protein